MEAAFQSDAFQVDAFQVVVDVCVPAFQPTAFQNNAFQVCVSEGPRGGGWVETREARKARKEYEAKRRESWRKLEETIEDAYAQATGQPRKAVKPVVKEALASRDPETVRRLAERLAASADPAAALLVQRIEARLAEISRFAGLIAEIEQEQMLARWRDEEDALALLLMVD